jgi:ArsR family transcriptional regulator
MQIAFPINEDQGLESPVHNHFGTASYFLIVTAEEGPHRTVANADLGHAHGQCQPLTALGGHGVDAIVVGNIGAGALRKIQSAGIRTFRAVEGSVSENLSLINAGKLPEFIMTQTCSGASCHH